MKELVAIELPNVSMPESVFDGNADNDDATITTRTGREARIAFLHEQLRHIEEYAEHLRRRIRLLQAMLQNATPVATETDEERRERIVRLNKACADATPGRLPRV